MFTCSMLLDVRPSFGRSLSVNTLGLSELFAPPKPLDGPNGAQPRSPAASPATAPSGVGTLAGIGNLISSLTGSGGDCATGYTQRDGRSNATADLRNWDRPDFARPVGSGGEQESVQLKMPDGPGSTRAGSSSGSTRPARSPTTGPSPAESSSSTAGPSLAAQSPDTGSLRRDTSPHDESVGGSASSRSGAPRKSRQTSYEADKEDLLDQHLAYFLRHHPEVFSSHQILRKRPGVYELDGREIRVEWQYAADPGGQGCLVAVDGPLKQPFADYMQMGEQNAEYDNEGIGRGSALHSIPKDKRMSFHDQHKMYSRLEAMKVAKEQACVREEAADFVKEGREVPRELMTRYKKSLSQKLDPGGNRRQAAQRARSVEQSRTSVAPVAESGSGTRPWADPSAGASQARFGALNGMSPIPVMSVSGQQPL
ncbi:unnamed protein product [Polarella glacialis]|uniref:Uncharacterized protein n=1 Tax=Polarella glacialis TaxID=89957 RepID=A0A813FU43_POLGL|nr:unnamed protein product [Polarella glacialis]